jgi:hypothetical protein
MARKSDVELCFDSMSDLITNLAGGLILVVMLLLAITREAPKTIVVDPNMAAGKKTAGEKSARELFQRLTAIELETARVDAELAADESLLKELDKKADDLLKKVAAAPKTPEKK